MLKPLLFRGGFRYNLRRLRRNIRMNSNNRIGLISQITPTEAEQDWKVRGEEERVHWAGEVAGHFDDAELSLAIRATGAGRGPLALSDHASSCEDPAACREPLASSSLSQNAGGTVDRCVEGVHAPLCTGLASLCFQRSPPGRTEPGIVPPGCP